MNNSKKANIIFIIAACIAGLTAIFSFIGAGRYDSVIGVASLILACVLLLFVVLTKKDNALFLIVPIVATIIVGRVLEQNLISQVNTIALAIGNSTVAIAARPIFYLILLALFIAGHVFATKKAKWANIVAAGVVAYALFVLFGIFTSAYECTIEVFRANGNDFVDISYALSLVLGGLTVVCTLVAYAAYYLLALLPEKEVEAKEEAPVEEAKEETPAEETKEEAPAEETKEEAPAEETKEEAPAEEAKEETPTEAADAEEEKKENTEA